MDGNDEARRFISWAAPSTLFLSPVALAIVIFRVVREKIAGIPVNLLDPDLLFIIIFCVSAFLVSLYFCRTELGWFVKKCLLARPRVTVGFFRAGMSRSS